MKILFSSLAALVCISAHVSAQTLAGYQSAINGQSPSYYFTLDNTLVDSVGGSLTLSSAGGAYAGDYFGNANNSRSFSGSTDSLSTTTDIFSGGDVNLNGNPSATGVGSVSFLFRTLADTNNSGQRFLFAQRSSTTGASNAFTLFFDNTAGANALKVRAGNGPTTTILSAASTVTNAWYYFAVTYDESRDADEVHWYLGKIGDPLSSGIVNIGNVAVVGDNGVVAIGNSAVGATGAYRSPGSGQIDEYAVWGRELSASEIDVQFATLVPEPSTSTVLGLGGLMIALLRRRR